MSQTSTDMSRHGPSFRGYVTGFVLALILTVIPFALAGLQWLSATTTLVLIAIAAVIQILVHLYYFLHLDLSPENQWNTASAAFSAVIVFILVGGTLWLFYSLHFRMMVGQ